jgi:hypothetical protein
VLPRLVRSRGFGLPLHSVENDITTVLGLLLYDHMDEDLAQIDPTVQWRWQYLVYFSRAIRPPFVTSVTCDSLLVVASCGLLQI